MSLVPISDSQASINDLHRDVMLVIFGYLAPSELRTCCLVSKTWQCYASNDGLWKSVYSDIKFPENVTNIKEFLRNNRINQNKFFECFKTSINEMFVDEKTTIRGIYADNPKFQISIELGYGNVTSQTTPVSEQTYFLSGEELKDLSGEKPKNIHKFNTYTPIESKTQPNSPFILNIQAILPFEHNFVFALDNNTEFVDSIKNAGSIMLRHYAAHPRQRPVATNNKQPNRCLLFGAVVISLVASAVWMRLSLQ